MRATAKVKLSAENERVQARIRRISRLPFQTGSAIHQGAPTAGDAPDFVEVGEAGIAVDDAMRRERHVQLVG